MSWNILFREPDSWEPFPEPPKPITVATTSGVLSEVNDEDCINVAKWKDWAGQTSFFHKTVRDLMLAGF